MFLTFEFCRGTIFCALLPIFIEILSDLSYGSSIKVTVNIQ